MDNIYPQWLSDNDKRNSSNEKSDEDFSIRRIQNEELDPFQLFTLKMDYLNTLR